MPTSADSKNKRVANGSPVTHQTLRQQGGTGEDSYTHLADCTLSVAVIEKKKKSVLLTVSISLSKPHFPAPFLLTLPVLVTPVNLVLNGHRNYKAY